MSVAKARAGSSPSRKSPSPSAIGAIHLFPLPLKDIRASLVFQVRLHLFGAYPLEACRVDCLASNRFSRKGNSPLDRFEPDIERSPQGLARSKEQRVLPAPFH